MNILHIVSSNGFYGKEQVILSLVKRQQQTPRSLLLVIGDQALHERALRLGARSVHLTRSGELVSAIRREGVEARERGERAILHTHDYKSGILVTGISRLRRWPWPQVRTLHGFTSANKPLLSKLRAYEALDRALLAHVDHVVGVSPAMQGAGVDSVIVNGIETPDHGPSTLQGSPAENAPSAGTPPRIGARHVVCIARLSAEKNPVNLIEAFATLAGPDLRSASGSSRPSSRDSSPGPGPGSSRESDPLPFRLTLVGDGPMRPELEALVDQRGLRGHVTFTGYRTDASRILADADLYVQPSFTEGMPISVLEAMAMGVPVLVSSVGGMALLIEQGAALECGTDPASIARAIRSAADGASPDLRENGKRLVRSEYAADVMARRYLDVYKTL